MEGAFTVPRIFCGETPVRVGSHIRLAHHVGQKIVSKAVLAAAVQGDGGEPAQLIVAIGLVEAVCRVIAVAQIAELIPCIADGERRARAVGRGDGLDSAGGWGPRVGIVQSIAVAGRDRHRGRSRLPQQTLGRARTIIRVRHRIPSTLRGALTAKFPHAIGVSAGAK